MSAPEDIGSQSPASAGSSRSFGTFVMPDLRDLSLKTEMQIRARSSYEEYKARGCLNALDVCIQSDRLIADLTEDDSPEKAGTLANLAMSLHARYESVRDSRDLEESISLARLAAAHTPEESTDKHPLLMNLATSLFSRFQHEGRPEDLEEAIRLEARAVGLVPDDHRDKPRLLNNLSDSLYRRFEYSGTTDDLETAISLQRHAVDLTPDSDSNKPVRLMNLGGLFHKRFERFGHLEDIERAIVLHGQSVDLTPDYDPDKAAHLNNAGNSLQARFNRLGNVEDLSLAIKFKSRAIAMSPGSHPDMPMWLNNLANSLHGRYERTGDAQDLEQAIVHQSLAVALTLDGHPDQPSRLNNLATKLQARFEGTGSLVDLDEAIAHLTNAVALAPDGHPDKHMWLYNLSYSLQQRFNQVGDAVNLEDAIRCSTRSVKLLPKNHPARAARLRLLGILFDTRSCSPHARPDDAIHAMEAFHTAMLHTNSLPLERLRASSQYATLLTKFPHLRSSFLSLPLLNVYEYALNLIPQCIWLGNTARGRYTSKELDVVKEVVNDAAAAAITAGEYGRALEWLETGRSIVWSQVLQLRTPVDNLRRLHPQLANELVCVSQALERAASSSPSAGITDHPTIPSLDTGAQSSHGYALEYDKLIARIRGLKGFEDFMRPKRLPQLANTCAAGPVVVINVHRSRCDALVLCRTIDVVHVPLPDFSLSQAAALQTLMWDVLAGIHLLNRRRGADMRDVLEGEDRGIKPRGAAKNGPDLMRRLLATLWVQVVKPIMDVVCPLVPNNSLPHITWCPTGPLSFLPLHAAGIYPVDEHDTNPSETVMDIAVSSYTPTLEALLRPRTRTAANDKCPRTLIVSQPNTPGHSSISGTTKEAGVIASLLDPSSSTILDHTEGTVNKVLASMATHPWVHLACHGIQAREDPLDSAFALYDGRLTLEMLMSKHLPNADLAVLSACQTATGDVKLPEEAVHLAAGMLNIGFKSVIGTMWSIYDSSAPVVMGEFYRVMAEQVKTGGELQPAYALHEATKVLRERYGVSKFVRWIPFIHFGL